MSEKPKGKVLRFVITGALLVAPAMGCGEDETGPMINEPAPEPMPTINEPAQPEPVQEPDGPQLPDETVDEPASDEAPIVPAPLRPG